MRATYLVATVTVLIGLVAPRAVAQTYWQVGGQQITTGTPSIGPNGFSGDAYDDLILQVEGVPALFLQDTNGATPNVIGGFGSNSVNSGAYGASIGGGGEYSYTNRVTDNFGTVGGGKSNVAGDNSGTTSDRPNAAVGGGYGNVATGSSSAIAGGYQNYAFSSYTAICGGQSNLAESEHATVGGGYDNIAGGGAYPGDTVAGGWGNDATGGYAFVGAGYYNEATGYVSTIGGGGSNGASQEYAVICGGYDNTASGYESAVGGGEFNVASGDDSFVAGGQSNAAAGDWSFAAGRRAKANSQGCFVWADSTAADMTCSVTNRVVMRGSGGFAFYTNSAMNVGVWLPSGSGSWASFSDSSVKRDVVEIDEGAILRAVAELPITSWRYQDEDASIRHIGPMAQDFYASFRLGESDTHIPVVDADGVALAAIKALKAEVDALRASYEAVAARGAAPAHAPFLSGLPLAVVALFAGVGLGAWIVRARTSRRRFRVEDARKEGP